MVVRMGGIERRFWRDHWSPGGPVYLGKGIAMHVQAFMYLLYARPKPPKALRCAKCRKECNPLSGALTCEHAA